MLSGRTWERGGSRKRSRSRSLRPMGWPWRLSLGSQASVSNVVSDCEKAKIKCG